MADRRQRKVEKKRRKRALAKKAVHTRAARQPSLEDRLVRSASHAPFGPCAISVGWDDEETSPPSLVTVMVTRVLGDGRLFPSVALVDRTCLGVKDGFAAKPVTPGELSSVLDQVFMAHGGWESCEPLVAQSVLFHAVDYARRLGFEPHPDAKLSLFGPRPSNLLATPRSTERKPFYVSGPNDDADAIIARLEKTAGQGNFDFVAHVDPFEVDEDEGWELDEGYELPPEEGNEGK